MSRPDEARGGVTILHGDARDMSNRPGPIAPTIQHKNRDLRAPFPWFGGKSRAAQLVWEAFGDVPNYVEPFAGSLAVLLARPHEPRIETVNGLDCFLANFWRALRAAPEEVAQWADAPVNEADLHARHRWLVDRAEFRERMMSDPDYHDAKIAGWWVWGLSCWIGSGWCAGTMSKQLPHLSTAGCGAVKLSKQLPHLGGSGMDSGRGVHSAGVRSAIYETFGALAARLRHVRVACGDWTRVLTDSVTWRHGTTGVFLDPPYKDGAISYAAGGAGISAAVREWAIAHGDDPRLRIALCGYEGEHEMPASWHVVEWKAVGGYAGQRKSDKNDNAARERIWFSPHCLQPEKPRQTSMFDVLLMGAS